MSKVLLANSYLYPLDAKQWAMQQPYPPLATLQAAAVLRQQGHSVSVFDVSLQHNVNATEDYLQSWKPDYLVIYDDGFNYLTKMCLTVMREAAFSMILAAKKIGSQVIVSSSDSTDHYEKYLNQGADFVIRGEGEETLQELMETLRHKHDCKNIKGLAYLTNGEPCVTPARTVMKNLDSLPMPAWDLIDLEPYKQIWLKHHGYFSLNIATTRGCPFKCNWCAKPIYGNRYNSRSPQHVADEIQWLVKNYQPDHFWMCDDIFGLKPGWIQEFNREVQNRNLKFRYKIQSRVDLLLHSDTIDALVESGVDTVWVGAESGSQKILDAMDKGTTIAQIHEATRLLQSKNAKVAFFLQFGYPGETKSDIRQTLKMVLQLMPDELGISVSYPLPGTKFYENVKMQLGAKQNWVDSDDLALMFQNTYPAPFYKLLHRYIHARHRMKKNFLLAMGWLRKPLGHPLTLKKILAIPYFLLFSVALKIRMLQFTPQTNG
ncbi:MAG: B12-binding domain-containing radical SAM protein [Flammeovirgaceae bacterium]